MDAEQYSNDILERMGRQSDESFDLQELETLLQPFYDQVANVIWAYTLAHSKPATED